MIKQNINTTNAHTYKPHFHKSWDFYEIKTIFSFVHSLESLSNRQKEKEKIFSDFTDKFNSICYI